MNFYFIYNLNDKNIEYIKKSFICLFYFILFFFLKKNDNKKIDIKRFYVILNIYKNVF